METTMRKAGFNGTPPEFYQFPRTDPQFYAKTPHQLIAEAAYIVKKADLKPEGHDRHLAAFPARHPAGARCISAHLHRWSRGAGELSVQHTTCRRDRSATVPSLVPHEVRRAIASSGVGAQAPERPKFRNDVYCSLRLRRLARYTGIGWARDGHLRGRLLRVRPA